MKNETNVIDTLWGIWTQYLCTFDSLGCVLLLVFGSEKVTRELNILKGQPPSISEQSNFIGNQFAIIFIIKPKLKTQKCIVWGLLSASFLNVFFPRPYSDAHLWLVDYS